MKKIYFLIFSLFFSMGIGTIHAQTDTINNDYRPLVQEGKKWSELSATRHSNRDNPMSYYTYNTYYFMIHGDTTIGDTEYKKLYYSSTKDPVFPDDWTLNSFLREDDSAKKVWQYKWSGPNYKIGEHLLYDFSLKIGDTIDRKSVV